MQTGNLIGGAQSEQGRLQGAATRSTSPRLTLPANYLRGGAAPETLR